MLRCGGLGGTALWRAQPLPCRSFSPAAPRRTFRPRAVAHAAAGPGNGGAPPAAELVVAPSGSAKGRTPAVAEESEYEEEPLTFMGVVSDMGAMVRDTNLGKGAALVGLAVLAGTLYIAFSRYWAKYTAPGPTRQRQVSKNKLLVEELSQTLPEARQALIPAKIKALRSKTKFTNVEIFRKCLWYMLRERTFDQSCVDDIVALRDACELNDDEVAEALRERAQRIYDKYGTLMLNTEGMTPQGIERKATCQNLFRKLLYLTEYEPLVRRAGGAEVATDLRKIFGALEEDIDRLRIVSLHDVDLEKAFGMQAKGREDNDDDLSSTDSMMESVDDVGMKKDGAGRQ